MCEGGLNICVKYNIKVSGFSREECAPAMCWWCFFLDSLRLKSTLCAVGPIINCNKMKCCHYNSHSKIKVWFYWCSQCCCTWHICVHFFCILSLLHHAFGFSFTRQWLDHSGFLSGPVFLSAFCWREKPMIAHILNTFWGYRCTACDICLLSSWHPTWDNWDLDGI